mgnify:CR=1 FL=1
MYKTRKFQFRIDEQTLQDLQYLSRLYGLNKSRFIIFLIKNEKRRLDFLHPLKPNEMFL